MGSVAAAIAAGIPLPEHEAKLLAERTKGKIRIYFNDEDIMVIDHGGHSIEEVYEYAKEWIRR